MNRKMFYVLGVSIIILSMILSACGAGGETPAPSTTQEPQAPVTTEEPKAAFEPQSVVAPDCNYGGNLKGIEALDEFTVKFSFCNPEPAFLPKISSVMAFAIHDSDWLQETGGDVEKINANPVGAGPYIVQEWVRGDHVTLVPNPSYFGEKPANQTLIFKWNKEAAARLLDLQAGNVSGIAEVTVDDIPTIEADSNLKLYPRQVNNFIYMGVNNTKPPFDNEKVRQAFAMAIDKQRIVDNFYAPGSIPATQFVPPGVKPGFTEGYAGVKYDPVKAKEMLEAEGFDFDAEYVLSYAERTRPYFPQPTKIAQDVQAQLAELGIKIKLELQEWSEYLPETRAGNKTLFFLGWSEDFPDATNWYDVFLTSSSKSFGNAYPDIEELIVKAASSADAAERQALYDQVNALYDQHVPTIVLAHGTTILAFQASVENVVLGPYNENFPQMKTADGTVSFSQDGEPVSLDCADETDGSSFRVCEQIYAKLYTFEWGTANSRPELAEKCEGNTDATEWTCTLKQGIKYSNGASLDANDVVVSFARGWDAAHPLHVGNSGNFQYFKDFFSAKLLNEPPEPTPTP